MRLPVPRDRIEAHPLIVYTHIFASLAALALGPSQFSQTIRARTAVVHRAIGRVYLVGVFIGGTAGLLISRIAFGGLVSMAGFSSLSILWLFTAGMALHAIRRGEVERHRLWMTRNFSLTFAAVTLRIYLGLFFAAGSSFEDFYPLLSWISWVPLIVLFEILRRGDQKPEKHKKTRQAAMFLRHLPVGGEENNP